MRVDIVTIFPEAFAPLDLSILGRARERGLLEIVVWDLREFTTDRHRQVDDSPYGGGAGMVMKPEPFLAAVDAIRGRTVSTFEALAPDMERAGAKFRNTEVVVDGNLVTSRTWMDLPFFMREFLKVLRASEKTRSAAG